MNNATPTYTETIVKIIGYLDYCRGLNIISENLYDKRLSYLITMALYGCSNDISTDLALSKLLDIQRGWERQDLDSEVTTN